MQKKREAYEDNLVQVQACYVVQVLAVHLQPSLDLQEPPVIKASGLAAFLKG